MQQSDIERLFTRSDGTYAFARWGRPIAPIVFGVQDDTLAVAKGACEAMCLLAGHGMAETDPELGSNLMLFFFSDWAELLDVPNLDQIIPELTPLVSRLTASNANQYRIFRFDNVGAIKASFVFLRMDTALQDMAAEPLMLSQIAQTMLLWSDTAFSARSPLAKVKDRVLLRPDIGEVIRAAYDPVMPVAAQDPSHALRLFARLHRT